MRADRESLVEGLLLRQSDRNLVRYDALCVVTKVDKSLFSVHWCDGYKHEKDNWSVPEAFEIILTEPAEPYNWKKGAKVLCVYNNMNQYQTGVVVDTYPNRGLDVTWDKDGSEGSGYLQLSSFLIIKEAPIEKAVLTKPPQPIAIQQAPLPSGFDWNKYNGIVRPKPTEQVMGVVNFDTYNNGPKRTRRA